MVRRRVKVVKPSDAKVAEGPGLTFCVAPTEVQLVYRRISSGVLAGEEERPTREVR